MKKFVLVGVVLSALLSMSVAELFAAQAPEKMALDDAIAVFSAEYDLGQDQQKDFAMRLARVASDDGTVRIEDARRVVGEVLLEAPVHEGLEAREQEAKEEEEFEDMPLMEEISESELEQDIKKAKVALEKKALEDERTLLTQAEKLLNQGDSKALRALCASAPANTIPLLSAKKFIIIANIAEHEIDSYTNNPYYQALVKHFGADLIIPVSAKIENELAQLSDTEAQEMMSMLGLKTRSLDTIIARTYQNLGLITFFTCGPKEIHAWPIKKGITVRAAAGEIHSDLEKGFIRADIFNYQDLVSYGSVAKLREAGKYRTEGQDYIMQDGDIILVKFNV